MRKIWREGEEGEEKGEKETYHTNYSLSADIPRFSHPTDADHHQLLPGQPGHLGLHDVANEHHLQLRLLPQQPLAVRRGLLQDRPVRQRAQRHRLRLHARRHLCR